MAISLQKGQRIDLSKKSGSKLTKFCVGANWGAIDVKKRGFLGFGEKLIKEAVDLDASCVMLNAQKEPIDCVFFNKLKSDDGAVRHSGDDRTGDVDGDDGLDNEIILVQLDAVAREVDQIVFFLNSFKGQDFATVPFASLRLYEGTPTKVNEVFATYQLASESSYSGHVSMVMGKLYRKNGEWKFHAIGEATRDRDLSQTIGTIISKYA